MIKSRFAPSPTGYVHIGNFRTALFEYLYARRYGGSFLLRIEDTDRERYVEGAIATCLRTLKWAGFVVDEGVCFDEKDEIIQKGENGPYIQSERLGIYQEYIKELLNKDESYYCFCTKERLEELRKMQELNKQATGYDKHCRNLSKEEVEKKISAGEKFVIRMKIPNDGVTIVNDLIHGKVEYNNSLIDDQVLIKADGFPTYHFAVVVDDHTMGVTHVVRGEDWLPSTPKHVILYNMFGWQAPEFAHLPLLVSKERKKLSKRQGDVAVEDFIKKGYLKEAIVNFVAFLGWNPGDDRELFTLEELEKEFDMSKVSKAAAVFNIEKLDWYNQQYIKKLDIADLTERCIPYLVEANLISNEQLTISNYKNWLQKVVSLEKERMVKLSDLPEAVKFVFEKDLNYEPEMLVWKKSDKVQTKEKLGLILEFLKSLEEKDWIKEKLEEKIRAWITEKNFGAGDILWPLRVALTGQKNSPGPFEVGDVLGKEESLKRIKDAFNKL